jgi:uncharacterized protein YbbC (DUF1343 family)
MRLLLPGLLAAFLLSGCGPAPSQTPTVMTGAEQTGLYLPMIKAKAVGLVANHTSLIAGRHMVDSLLALQVNLKKIFAPEHGFRGDAGAGDLIDHSVDLKTGTPVISLYGSRKKPSKHDLQDIEIMVYDIQDVGVRFYTYISTLHYVMEACAENNIPLIILDRPNPLGFYVDGPVLETTFRSFVGMHPIPVVYGMTVGELAQMINGEGWLSNKRSCQLTIIPCNNYNHALYYELPTDPSPNLNSMQAVYLYPSLCFFEGTIMSVGRGTPFPFRVAGHPEYPDTSFSFVPHATIANNKPLFAGLRCYGINLQYLDVVNLQQMRELNLEWLINAYKAMGRNEVFFTEYINKLAGTDSFSKQIIDGWTEEEMRQSWQTELQSFMNKRKRYLLYDDFN